MYFYNTFSGKKTLQASVYKPSDFQALSRNAA